VEDEIEPLDLDELREGESRYAAKMAAGKRVPVTVRGRVVGHLVPTDEASSPFERLVAAGQVRRATGRGIADLLPIPPAVPGESSPNDELVRMREEERY
jgi:antitoxin (DNA-binding transcriptional repressor) of toxin-antitoxin stability system